MTTAPRPTFPPVEPAQIVRAAPATDRLASMATTPRSVRQAMTGGKVA